MSMTVEGIEFGDALNGPRSCRVELRENLRADARRTRVGVARQVEADRRPKRDAALLEEPGVVGTAHRFTSASLAATGPSRCSASSRAPACARLITPQRSSEPTVR
jgi:hypothetical protein